MQADELKRSDTSHGGVVFGMSREEWRRWPATRERFERMPSAEQELWASRSLSELVAHCAGLQAPAMRPRESRPRAREARPRRRARARSPGSSGDDDPDEPELPLGSLTVRSPARGLTLKRKACEECGALFEFQRSTARFCSAACKQRPWDRKQSAAKSPALPTTNGHRPPLTREERQKLKAEIDRLRREQDAAAKRAYAELAEVYEAVA